MPQEPVTAHIKQTDYEALCSYFSWEDERKSLRLNESANIAYHAVDKHAKGILQNTVALRWLAKDKTIKDITFSTLKDQTSRYRLFRVCTSACHKKEEFVRMVTST